MSDLPKLTGKSLGKLANGRLIMENEGGGFSTQRLATVNDGRLFEGAPVNIPTMFGGKEVSVDEAIEIIVKNKGIDPDTGVPIKSFKSIDEAIANAKSDSKQIEEELDHVLRQMNR